MPMLTVEESREIIDIDGGSVLFDVSANQLIELNAFQEFTLRVLVDGIHLHLIVSMPLRPVHVVGSVTSDLSNHFGLDVAIDLERRIVHRRNIVDLRIEWTSNGERPADDGLTLLLNASVATSLDMRSISDSISS